MSGCFVTCEGRRTGQRELDYPPYGDLSITFTPPSVGNIRAVVWEQPAPPASDYRSAMKTASLKRDTLTVMAWLKRR